MSQSNGVAVLLYALFDLKMREYGQLAPAKNDEAIRRSLLDAVRGSGSVMEKHPGDFELHQLGEWFPETGFLAGRTDLPRFVVNLADLLDVPRGPDVETAPSSSRFELTQAGQEARKAH